MSESTLVKLLDRTLGLEYGLIRYIKEIPLMPDEPDIFIAITEFQNPFIVTPQADKRRPMMMEKQAAGAGLDRLSAIWSAVGEAIERYAGAIYDPQQLTWAASRQLREDDRVTPNDFILFSKEQYKTPTMPYRAHDPDQEIGWTNAIRLSDGKSVLMPAALTYLGYTAKTKSEYVADMYSTGLACGPSRDWAVCSGLYEAIERDAYALHWAARRPARRISIQKAIACADADLKKLLTHAGVDLFLGDITTDIGVPCVLAIARHKSKPGIALGASCNLSAPAALRKAVIECFHTFNWCIEMHRWPKAIDEGSVNNFSDHVRYYLDPERESQASFFWDTDSESTLLDGPPSTGRPTPDHSADLQNLVARLSSHGHQSYAVDITPPDIADLGLHVVRAISPGLQPMWCGHGRAPLDRRRFEAFLRHLGEDTNKAINIQIHPFP